MRQNVTCVLVFLLFMVVSGRSYAYPYLLLHDIHSGPAPTPTFINQNKAFLETLPFDGLSVSLWNSSYSYNASRWIFSGTPVRYETLYSILAPMAKLSSRTLRYNFAFVQSTEPVPDFFDDAGWATITSNFANLALAARNAGLTGIMFDNEQYFQPNLWGCYGYGNMYCKCNSKLASTKSLDQYQTQARARGKAIMRAIVANYPGIEVMHLHGPYVSATNLPWRIFPQAGSHFTQCNNLQGPFFVGFVEGSGTSSVVNDGGELYDIKEYNQFADTYNWRKYTITAPGSGTPFIPEGMRSSWSRQVGVNFGVTANNWKGSGSSPWLLQNRTVPNALRLSDRFAWVFVEGFTFLSPSSTRFAGYGWINAIRAGKVS